MFPRGAMFCPGMLAKSLHPSFCRWMSTHYETLQVPRTASAKEIKAAFHKLSKQYHPDLHRGDKSMHDRFVTINAAYSVLSDKVKKLDYDRTLEGFKRYQSAARSTWTGPRGPAQQRSSQRSTAGSSRQQSQWSQYEDYAGFRQQQQQRYGTDDYYDYDQRPRQQQQQWQFTWQGLNAEYDKHYQRMQDDNRWRYAPINKRRRSNQSQSAFFLICFLFCAGMYLFYRRRKMSKRWLTEADRERALQWESEQGFIPAASREYYEKVIRKDSQHYYNKAMKKTTQQQVRTIEEELKRLKERR